MIISASRRTDIPAFHAEWMMERLREGFAYVRNPFNVHQVSRVSLTRENAEAIVFWTKDAGNMLSHLEEMEERGYRYLFQYTLTPYGRDIEKNVDKRRALEAFLKLSGKIGKQRVIWRYDPILLTQEWTAERHSRMFERMCMRLTGATDRCVISFVDLYAAVKRRAPQIHAPGEAEMRLMAREIARIAQKYGMTPSACAEKLDFSGEGLEARGCIDAEDIGRLLGVSMEARRDDTQRGACRCIKSVDIGAYDTCAHGCLYCYARPGRRAAEECDVHSPFLCGHITEGDRVIDRKEKKAAPHQLSMLD